MGRVPASASEGSGCVEDSGGVVGCSAARAECDHAVRLREPTAGLGRRARVSAAPGARARIYKFILRVLLDIASLIRLQRAVPSNSKSSSVVMTELRTNRDTVVRSAQYPCMPIYIIINRHASADEPARTGSRSSTRRERSRAERHLLVVAALLRVVPRAAVLGRGAAVVLRVLLLLLLVVLRVIGR